MPALNQNELKEFKALSLLPLKERNRRGLTVKKICDMFHITINTYYKLSKRIDGDDEYDSQVWLDSKTKVVDEALLKACDRGSPQALQTFYKLNQRLVDRKEETVKVEFTTGDRQELTANIINGLKEDARITGVCSVCGISQALCDEPLLLTESEYTEDRTVEAVEVSA